MCISEWVFVWNHNVKILLLIEYFFRIFFNIYALLYLFNIYLFIFGFPGSLLLHVGFLLLQRLGATL